MRMLRNIGGGVILATGIAITLAVVVEWSNTCGAIEMLIGAAVYGIATIGIFAGYMKFTNNLND